MRLPLNVYRRKCEQVSTLRVGEQRLEPGFEVVVIVIERAACPVRDGALLGLAVTMKEDQVKQKEWADKDVPTTDKLGWNESRAKGMARCRKAWNSFDESNAFVRIVCTEPTCQHFLDLNKFVADLAAEITKDASAYDAKRKDLMRKIILGQKAMRSELDVDSMSQSSESSTAPNPAPK